MPLPGGGPGGRRGYRDGCGSWDRMTAAGTRVTAACARENRQARSLGGTQTVTEAGWTLMRSFLLALRAPPSSS
jgi:hypothetical protein